MSNNSLIYEGIGAKEADSESSGLGPSKTGACAEIVVADDKGRQGHGGPWLAMNSHTYRSRLSEFPVAKSGHSSSITQRVTRSHSEHVAAVIPLE